MFFKQAVVAATLALLVVPISAQADATASQAAIKNSNAVAAAYRILQPIGNVAAVQAPLGNSYLFWQDRCNGSIMWAHVTNAFEIGKMEPASVQVLAPGNQVLWNTPIAVTQQSAKDNDTGYLELFYFSPDYTLIGNRYVGGWLGTDCKYCVTHEGYKAQPGSRVLYALGSGEENVESGMRVGFISQDYPDTITEADRMDIWRLAPLRN